VTKHIENSIREIADSLRDYVKGVEDSPATTQNHYAEYMGLMSKFTDDRNQALVLVAALKAAGANHAGVDAAFKVTYG